MGASGVSGWLLDTSVLIAHSRGHVVAARWLEQHIDHCQLSVLTVAEFMQGVIHEKERLALQSYCECFGVLPVTTEIALQAGRWGRQFGKSHQLHMTDLLMAATAQVGGLRLATHNLKHYPMFAGLEAPF